MFETFGAKHQKWKLFSDFLWISAVALNASYQFDQQEARERRYAETAAAYSQGELAKMADIYAQLVMAMEEQLFQGHPNDLLGPLYHALELHKHRSGQFFTHRNITTFTAFALSDAAEKDIERYGYYRTVETSCGSGAFILSQAEALIAAGHDPSHEMVAVCLDTDPVCVLMCYLQLGLYGIPAAIFKHDGLAPLHKAPALEDTWFTPLFSFYGWDKWNFTDYANHETKEHYQRLVGDWHCTPITINALCEQLRRINDDISSENK